MPEIERSIENAIRYLSEHPDEARYTDTAASATLREALRVDVDGPGGERVVTDMPTGVGGQGEHPSPGWLFRAALASCVASTIGMQAAREGVTLESLVVEVDSESDDRGVLGMDPSVPAGPISARIRVQARGDGVAGAPLEETLERGAARCPVCDATKRVVDVSLEIRAS